jgi:Ca2+-binding RTX toxin-like protein
MWSTPTCIPLRLETLERRDVPATVAYDASTLTLTITGTDPVVDPVTGLVLSSGADAVQVTQQGKDLVVTTFSDGDLIQTVETFLAKDVQLIQIFGLGGDDQLDCSGTRSPAVYIDGGDGADAIYAGSGDATLIGGAGNDLIQAGSGNDTLFGDDPNNPLAAGDDTLIGGHGTNVMTGGLGADTFYAGSKDTVTDFNALEGDVLADPHTL